MSEFAATLSRQSGRPIACHNLSQAGLQEALVKAGLPEFVAAILADSDAGAAAGWLSDDSKTLERLIGRPTTSLAQAMEQMLATRGA